MSDRYDKRENYIQGWYQLDAQKLLDSTVDDFLFEDPYEPEAITRPNLPAYMKRWDERTRALGADNQWKLTHEVRVDKDGVLTDWEWWELLGSGLEGTAVIQTSDEGVIFEKITYFDRSVYS